jgi:DNA-binding response OmpR family regulator
MGYTLPMSGTEGKRVFLVEDNMEVSRMYERAFRLRGHEVDMAYDGHTALEKIKQADPAPEAIVLDVMIPHMNGVDLLREIRKDPRLADVPIAILTNSFHKDDEAIFLDLGADLYLVKLDNQSKDVVDKIEALIRKHAGPSS